MRELKAETELVAVRVSAHGQAAVGAATPQIG